MSNPSKQKGTAAETAVVKYLRERGFIYAYRPAPAGGKDKGDISGVPGVVFEVKDCKKAEPAKWLDELAVEMRNAHAPIGVVVRKRARKGAVGEWFAIMPMRLFVDLIEEMEIRDGRRPTVTKCESGPTRNVVDL